MNYFLVKEQRKYGFAELARLLPFSLVDFWVFIQKLLRAGFIKEISKEAEKFSSPSTIFSDSLEEDSSTRFFTFCFVGILSFKGQIIVSYPKFFVREPTPEEIKLFISVIRKYKEEVSSCIRSEVGETIAACPSSISSLVFFISDYISNGCYLEDTERVNDQGEGQILWGKTIDSFSPFLQRGRPVYVNTFARCATQEDDGFFPRLHKAIVTACSDLLKKSNLSFLLDIPLCEETRERISDLGAQDYILSRVQRERSVQFDNRKRMLLLMMELFVKTQWIEQGSPNYSVDLYGTTSFNLLWEEICASVFDSDLEKPLKSFPFLLGGGKDSLLESIDKPLWSFFDPALTVSSRYTLRPDLAKFSEKDGRVELSILDAKYYCISLLEGSISGQPGVEDVAKQHLYQLALSKVLRGHTQISRIKNYFLLPTQEENVRTIAAASLPFLTELGLSEILVCLLPAKEMMQCYLCGRSLEASTYLHSEGSTGAIQ